MIGRKVCPRCAESIKKAAKVCRYCAYEYTDESNDGEIQSNRVRLFLGIAIALTVCAGSAYFWFMQGIQFQPTRPRKDQSSIASASDKAVAYEQIAIGDTFEWRASEQPTETTRQSGPFLITVRSGRDEDLVFPIVTVQFGKLTTSIEGEPGSSDATHKIGIYASNGPLPFVMLQSFSGGAHCCNHVQVAGVWNALLKTVDLGSWDGDNIDLPKDITGDGVADIEVSDDRFLYAFASYASSYAPPKFLNIVSGQAVDVSSRPHFRQFFLKSMRSAGNICSNGETGDERNGACPAYVASAARVGKLDAAWKVMTASYDAAYPWDLPTGCMVATEAACPENKRIVYKSYPEALLAFLKRGGYVPKSWQPSSFSESDAYEESEGSSDDVPVI